MKFIALLAMLVLHATGAWPQLSATTRDRVSSAPAGAPAVAQQSATAPPVPLAPLPLQTGTQALHIDAASAYAVDLATGTVLYNQDGGQQRPIASVTKMVTALIILSRHSTDDIITVPPLPTYETAAEIMGLVPGERYRVGDLLTAALVPSDNDAAEALAIYDAGSLPKFAALMNATMANWNITGTRFVSASGLQDTGNYATAEALAKIAGLALTNPTFRQIVQMTDANFTSQTGRQFTMTSTNKLLASGGFYGIKTGYTPAAGECFVGLTRIHGHEVITVVLGADSRFGASQALANWIGQNWVWL